MICADAAFSVRAHCVVSGPLTIEMPYGTNGLPAESWIRLPATLRVAVGALPALTGPHGVRVTRSGAEAALNASTTPATRAMPRRAVRTLKRAAISGQRG